MDFERRAHKNMQRCSVAQISGRSQDRDRDRDHRQCSLRRPGQAVWLGYTRERSHIPVLTGLDVVLTLRLVVGPITCATRIF